MLKKFFQRGAAEAPAAEMREALVAAEKERQTLRGEEQQLAGDRQRLLLEGDDAQLDEVEARLAAIARSAERLDLRIPALREAWEAKAAAERSEADSRVFEEATTQRLAVAEQIDVKFAELGALFAELEKPAERLRGLGKGRGIDGPMGRIELDGQVTRSVLLHHAPTLARSLAIDPRNTRGPNSLLAAERDFMNMLRGIRPVVPTRPDPPQPTVEEMEAADIARHHARRYGGDTA